MKKVVFIFTIVFTILLSSVTFAHCTLNRRQWGYIGNSGNVEMYIDMPNVKVNGNLVETGLCYYFPTGCNMKHRGSKVEHYHMSLISINYNFNSYAVKSLVYGDISGNQTGGNYFDDDEVTYHPIPRNSLLEKFCITALKIAGLY